MQQQAAPQSFHRGKDRILGGVCSGLAEGLHIDALWVRLGFVLLAFLQGVGLLVYLVLWLVMPEKVEGQDGARSGFDSMTGDLKRIGGELRSQFGGSPKAAAKDSPPPADAPAPGGAAPATSAVSTGRTSIVLGVVLVVVGLIVLGANTGLVQWSVIWPTVLIIIGVLLLARTLDGRRQP
ncbi:MAG TPA: PspC domain-containing protein [Candidatus Dormibacteraeota bacterium]|nr:PspC domain-containing protein [Candidatus Dormibacteraeota bacterium]